MVQKIAIIIFLSPMFLLYHRPYPKSSLCAKIPLQFSRSGIFPLKYKPILKKDIITRQLFNFPRTELYPIILPKNPTNFFCRQNIRRFIRDFFQQICRHNSILSFSATQKFTCLASAVSQSSHLKHNVMNFTME